MIYLSCALGGYLIGTINPSYIIAKIKGFDIRQKGSGNAGGSNALITMGNRIGAFCMILDILKAYFVALLANYFFPGNQRAVMLAGVMCIVGHMFPFYMNFRGGKGLACLGGLIFAYSSKLFVLMLAIAFVMVLLTDYICIAPITASIAFPVVYGFYEKDLIGGLILAIGTVVICCKHIENLKRISKGTEAHFSYLWKKDEEMERVRKNLEDN